jgi:guanylate kinase
MHGAMPQPRAILGHIFLLVGPSGGGKTTLIRRVAGAAPPHPDLPAFRFVPSTTSRPPRPGERDGVDYHFVSEGDFERLAAAGEFLEWQRVHGFRYGSSRARLLAATHDGGWGITSADILGAFKIKAALPDLVSTVFVTPSDASRLRDRIQERAPLSEAEMERRLGRVAMEMQLAHACDRLVLNDDLEQAARRLCVCAAAQLEAAARRAHFGRRPVIRMVDVGPPPRPECGRRFCVADSETPEQAVQRVLHQWWWECHPRAASFDLPPWQVRATDRQEYVALERVTLDVTWWTATGPGGRPFGEAALADA